MAITISIKLDASDLSKASAVTAPLSSAFKVIQDQLKQIETASGQTTSNMITGLKQLSQQGTVTAFGQGALGKAFLQTGQAAGATSGQLKALGTAAKGSELSTRSLLATLLEFAGIQGAVQVLRDLLRSVIENGVAFQGLRIQFETVFGSLTAGKAAFEDISEISRTLGINLRTTAEAYGSLAASTKDTNLEGKATREVFVAVAQAARALHLSQDQVSRTFLALSEMAGKGVISMEELRRQLGQALPGSLQAMARALPEANGSLARLFGLVESGILTVQQLFPAITQGLTELTQRTLPQSLDSAAAAFGRLTTAWQELSDTFAQAGFLDLVTRLVQQVTTGLNALSVAVAFAGRGFERAKTPIEELQEQLVRLQTEMQRTEATIKRLEEAGGHATIWQKMFQAIGGPDATQALDAARSKMEHLTKVYQALQAEITQTTQEAGAPSGRTPAEIAAQNMEELITRLKVAGEGLDVVKIQGKIKTLDDTLKILARTPTDVERTALLERIFPGEKDVELRANTLVRQLQETQKKAQIEFKSPFAAADVQRQNAAIIAQAETAVSVTQSVQQKRLALWQADKAAAHAALAADEQTALGYVSTVREREQVLTAFQIRRIDLEQSTALKEISLGHDRVTAEASVQNALVQARISALKKLAAVQPPEEAKGTLAAITELEGQLVALRARTTAQFAALEAEEVKTEAGYAKGITEVREKEWGKQLQLRKQRLDAEAKLELATLQGQSSIYDAQLALAQANMEARLLLVQGNVFAEMDIREQGYQEEARFQAVQFENRVKQLENQRQTELRIAQQNAIDIEQLEQQKTEIKTKYDLQRQALDVQHQVTAQTLRNQELQEWRQFVSKVEDIVGNFLYDLFSGQIKGIQDLLNRLKNYFFRTLAEMIAQAVANPIAIVIRTVVGGITSSIGSVIGQVLGTGAAALGAGVGGGGGTGGGDLLGTGGTALTGIGLARSLYSMLGLDTLMGYVGRGFTALSQTFIGGIDTLFGTSISAANQAAAEAIELAATGAQAPGGGAAAVAGSQAGAIAGIAGGLAALGGGIYAALNASNNAAKAAYAASAAAGAFAAGTAAYGAVTGAAVVTAGGTGWTGIGLIVAAVLAIIGTVLDRVIKPAGPSLSVGRPGGLRIEQEGGKLGVQGDLGTQVTRRVGITQDFAKSVQAQMEEGITSAVLGVVQAINAVALDPVKLLGPTNEALQNALNAIQPLNTANAKKMTQDIKEQLRFINIAIVGGLLGPLNQAFDQLRDQGDLEEQIERLPGTTSGLVAIFKNLNVQLDEIAKSENTDVLRQISGVRNKVEDFGAKIANTAAQTAESIVNGIIEMFAPASRGLGISPGERLGGQGADMLEAASQAMQDLDLSLAEQITQFSTQMTKAYQALGSLRATQQTLESVGLPGGGVGAQIERLTKVMSEQATRISTQIVSTALGDLATELDQVLVQPIAIQATTVNSLFTDSLAAMQALWLEWHRLGEAGLDFSGVQEQYTRLQAGLFDAAGRVIDQALREGSFAEFLSILASIPPALTATNPAWQRLQQLGQIFSQVVAPIEQSIATIEDAMRTTAERVVVTSTRIADLRSAIADAGDAADKALPLYAQLAQAIVTHANLQIQAIQEIQQAQEEALSQVESAMDSLEETLVSAADRIPAVLVKLATSMQDFYTAMAAGDLVGVIRAIQAYQQQIVAYANLLIQQIQAERQAVLDAQQDVIEGIQDQIEAVNDAISAQQEYISTLRDEVSTRQDAVDAIRREIASLTQLRDRVSDLTRAGLSPARQAPAIREQLAATQAHLGTVSGDEAIQDLEKLISLNEELKQLGEQTDQLILVKEALDNLAVLQDQLNAQLSGAQARLSPAEAQLETSKAALDSANAQLDTLNAQLDTLQKELEAQQEILKELEESTYWDEQIAVIQAALYEQLKELQKFLIDMEGDTTWEDQIKAIQQDAVSKLSQINDDLRALFLKMSEANNTAGIIGAKSADLQGQMLERLRTLNEYNLKLPVPIEVKNFYEAPHQRGGLVGYASGMYYAQGGMVPPKPSMAAVDRVYDQLHVPHQRFAQGGMVATMVEPGESYWTHYTAQQGKALLAWNEAFPRFARGGLVPGTGDGDRVPMWFPEKTIIVNREGTQAMREQHYQGGGTVQGNTSSQDNKPRDVHIHVDLRGSTFSKNITLDEFKALMEMLKRRGLQQ